MCSELKYIYGVTCTLFHENTFSNHLCIRITCKSLFKSLKHSKLIFPLCHIKLTCSVGMLTEMKNKNPFKATFCDYNINQLPCRL